MENDLSGDDIIRRKGRMSILFFLALTADNRYYFFREDLSEGDRVRIKSIDTQEITANIEAYRQILEKYHCDETYWGATYIFATPPSPKDFPDVTILGQGPNPIFAIEKDGKIISKAWTWGENPVAVEVEVMTDEAYRKKGYGKQTVSAWAEWHLRNHRIAFFSHEYSNFESGRLADKLNLVKIASIFIFYEKIGKKA